MSDFDFDELDKAVSGVLGSTAKDDQAKQSTAQAVPVATSAVEPVATSSSPISSSPLSTAPAARRSTGRFMDVVHPSSDMRTRTESDRNTPAWVSDRPDESSFDANSKTSVDTPRESTPIETPEPDWSQPLESPFLPDAKVEKRPLGGEALMASVFEVENTLAESRPDIDASGDSAPEAHTMPDPLDFATQAPSQEPTGELSQREAESAILPKTDLRDDTPSTQINELFPEHLDDIDPESTPVSQQSDGTDTPETDTPEKKEQIEPAELAGPASIVQQYTEAPRSEQISGPIFDTEAYHQPVAHPIKKKSGVGIILAILGLLAVGAGAGVAFYFYVLPML